jgi:hypothetical protein
MRKCGKILIAWIGAAILAAIPTNSRAQNEPKTPDEARKLVIEYRDGTRQTIQLEKDWWEILNVLFPEAPAPVGKSPLPKTQPAPGASVRTDPLPIPVPKSVNLNVSGKWVNWRRGEKKVYTMRLVQTGKRVQGLHRLNPNFIIDGTLEGNVWKGTWSSPDLVGEFIFEFSEDGDSFQGRWNTTNDLRTWNLGWNGRRQ